MDKMRWIGLALVVAMALPALAQGAPDFSRTVALGDSLTAGYWNGSLNERGQANSYAVLVTRQAGANLALPLVSYPGIPIALKLEGYDPATGLPVIVYDGTQEGTLENPASQPTNLAVPGDTSVDCLTKVPDDQMNTMTDLVLGYPWVYVEQKAPLSQVDLAKQLDPTFVILWIGSDDVLGAALGGDPSYAIPSATFSQTYPAILKALSDTGAKLVVANIPDVTIIPALTKGVVLQQLGIDLKRLGIKKNDCVTPYALDHVERIVKGLDPGPLTASEVLTASEAKAIQSIVKQDNKVLANLAKQYRIPMVDVYKELNKIGGGGYTLPGGQLLTTAYLGGIFSVDGVHPTSSGQAILANDFIDAINAGYGTQMAHVDVPVPTADELSVPSTDSLVQVSPKGEVRILEEGGLNLPVLPRPAPSPAPLPLR